MFADRERRMYQDSSDAEARTPGVLFIRGITQRSGTNFLRDLLLLHPECVPARAPVWEDFALNDVQLLEAYIERTMARWPLSWAVPKPSLADEIRAELGSAMIRSTIGVQEGRTTIAKTPSVQGLEAFFRYFPGQRLVLLVRDGRDVVESMMRSFGWSFSRSLHEWTESAEAIIRFRRLNAAEEDRTWMLARYEELLEDGVGQIDRICRFAGLPTGRIDPADVASLPVRGSSTFATDDGVVHWRPVTPDGSFRPRKRWTDWSTGDHERFNFVAGRAMTELGYDISATGSLTAARRAMYRVGRFRSSSDAKVRNFRRIARRHVPDALTHKDR